MSNKYRLALAAGFIASFALVGTAFAQRGVGRGHMGMMHNGIFGTVASVSGNTLTVTSKTWVKPTPGTTPTTTTTTYSVDATNAKITKNNATSSITGIVVGDTVMVQGTVTGTSVTATSIHDGMPTKPVNPPKTKQPIVEGNGQPVIGGTVSAVSGTTLTVTNKNVTYTVNASSATVTKNNAASTLSAVAVNDNVIIQGTVNGTSVTASSVTDHSVPATGTNPKPGLFHDVGNFFKHLFGF